MSTEYKIQLDGMLSAGFSSFSTASSFCRSTTLPMGDILTGHYYIARILSNQSYYWTDLWQQGERESRSAIQAGEGRVFADPAEAMKWLQEHDDEDE